MKDSLLLCHRYDLCYREAREFDIGTTPVLAILDHDDVRVFFNQCPHAGERLNISTDDIVSPDGRHIFCSTHGAVFRLSDGRCTAGPCTGASLQRVDSTLYEDKVYLRVPSN